MRIGPGYFRNIYTNRLVIRSCQRRLSTEAGDLLLAIISQRFLVCHRESIAGGRVR